MTVRRRLRVRRVGHAGTLDPMGTGLLVMGVGPGTRFLRYLETEPKEYKGEITFGVSTNTQDADGEVLSRRDASELTLSAIREAAERFVGEIEQMPPMFSAVKIGGERLYRRARRGEEVERPTKKVTVERFTAGQYDPPVLSFTLTCSGGTYVRTLANDLGEALGTGAHLSALTRTAIGRFQLKDACCPDDADVNRIISLGHALEPMPMARLTRTQARAADNGRPVAVPLYPNRTEIGLLDSEGRFFAIARQEGGVWQPECVMHLSPEG